MIVHVEGKVLEVKEKSYESKGEIKINNYVKIKQLMETLELRLPDDVTLDPGQTYNITANYVRRYNEERKQYYIFWDVVEAEVVR